MHLWLRDAGSALPTLPDPGSAARTATHLLVEHSDVTRLLNGAFETTWAMPRPWARQRQS
jgi:hypothetical protein